MLTPEERNLLRLVLASTLMAIGLILTVAARGQTLTVDVDGVEIVCQPTALRYVAGDDGSYRVECTTAVLFSDGFEGG